MFLQNGITLKEEYAVKMDVVIVPIPVYKLSEGGAIKSVGNLVEYRYLN